jgi:hypothetical protein
MKNKYISEGAKQYQAKRLEETRRELEEQLGRELARQKAPSPPLNSLPVTIPPPGSPEHIRMWLHPISRGEQTIVDGNFGSEQ